MNKSNRLRGRVARWPSRSSWLLLSGTVVAFIGIWLASAVSSGEPAIDMDRRLRPDIADRVSHGGTVSALWVSPNDHLILAGRDDGLVFAWRVWPAKLLFLSDPFHTAGSTDPIGIAGLFVPKDGKTAVVAGWNGGIATISLTDGRVISELAGRLATNGFEMQIFDEGRRLAQLGADRRISGVAYPSGAPLHSKALSGKADSIAVSPSGNLVAVQSAYGVTLETSAGRVLARARAGTLIARSSLYTSGGAFCQDESRFVCLTYGLDEGYVSAIRVWEASRAYSTDSDQ